MGVSLPSIKQGHFPRVKLAETALVSSTLVQEGYFCLVFSSYQDSVFYIQDSTAWAAKVEL